MDSNKQKLKLVLETHFCDLKDTSVQESILAVTSDAFFQHVEFNKNIKIFESLSDEKRIKILMLLTFRDMCNCELTAAIKSTQPNLTYHIKKLENAGLVKKRREGKYVYYSLDETSRVQNIIELIRINLNRN